MSKSSGGLSLDPVWARRGVDCAVLCGACHHQIARRRRRVLLLTQPRLQVLVAKLPATVDCPFCHVPNLLDPTRLNVDECRDFETAPGDVSGRYGAAPGLLIF